MSTASKCFDPSETCNFELWRQRWWECSRVEHPSHQPLEAIPTTAHLGVISPIKIDEAPEWDCYVIFRWRTVGKRFAIAACEVVWTSEVGFCMKQKTGEARLVMGLVTMRKLCEPSSLNLFKRNLKTYSFVTVVTRFDQLIFSGVRRKPVILGVEHVVLQAKKLCRVKTSKNWWCSSRPKVIWHTQLQPLSSIFFLGGG